MFKGTQNSEFYIYLKQLIYNKINVHYIVYFLAHLKYHHSRNLDYWNSFDLDAIATSPNSDVTSRLITDHDKNTGRKNRLVL